MTIVFVGIDLAKSVFAPHGVDEMGKPALVRRDQLLAMVAKLPPCVVATAACSGADRGVAGGATSANEWSPRARLSFISVSG